MPHAGKGPDDSGRNGALTRRKWLQMLGITGAAGLAGCTGGGDGSNETTATTTTDTGFGDETQTSTTAETEEIPQVGGTYTQAVSSSFESLNPIYNTESTTGDMIAKTADGTYGFKPGQNLFPRLADISSDDKQVWTVNLRENLRWSEPYGEVTAEDYVYLIENVHKSDWAGSPQKSDWMKDGNPIPVRKTGKYSFKIELPSPDIAYPKRPNMWGMQVVPKDLIKSYVDNQDAKGLEQDKELGDLSYTGNLGAYDLENWERQKKLTFTRSDEYYMREAAANDDAVPRRFKKAPYFDTVEVQVIKESSSRLSALKTGQLDTASIPPNKASGFKSRDDVYLNVTPQPYNVPLFYNQRANGWKLARKKGVRQALGLAVDKEKYVKGVYRGYADPQFTWQPRWSPWYNDSKVVKYGVGDKYGSDVARSRMKKALSDTDHGYNGDTLVNGDGEQVTLDLMYQSSQPTEVSTAQFLKKELSDNLGIKLNLNGIGATKFVKDYWQQQIPDNADQLEWSNGKYNAGPRDKATSKKAWDMALVYGLNTYPMTPTTSEFFFTKDSTYNPYGYYPSYNFDELYSEAKNATSTEKRKEVLGEIFGKISRDQPMGMLAMNSDITGYRQGINGPVEEFFNGWDIETWFRADK